MCCTSRKDTRVKYTYTPTSSPWNQRFLYRIWFYQLVTLVVVSAISVGLIPLKDKEHRPDDGYSLTFYWLNAIIIASTTVTFIGFLVLQVYWYKKNELHPGWALACNIYMTFLYLLIISMAGAVLLYVGQYFNGFDVVLLAQGACSISGILLLFYHIGVYSDFRKSRKRERDIELQNGLR